MRRAPKAAAASLQGQDRIRHGTALYFQSVNSAWCLSFCSALCTILRVTCDWVDAAWETVGKHTFMAKSRDSLRSFGLMFDKFIITTSILVLLVHALALRNIAQFLWKDAPEPAKARVVVVARKSEVHGSDDERIPIAESTVRSSPATNDCLGLVGVVVEEEEKAPEGENKDRYDGASMLRYSTAAATPSPLIGTRVVGSRNVSVIKRRRSFLGNSAAIPSPLTDENWGMTTKQGNLKKRSSFEAKRSLYPRWQRRYFVASGNNSGSWLRYFMYIHRKSGDDLRASIDLYKLKLLPSNGTKIFTLLLGDGKIELQAESAAAAVDWCRHIEKLQRTLYE